MTSNWKYLPQEKSCDFSQEIQHMQQIVDALSFNEVVEKKSEMNSLIFLLPLLAILAKLTTLDLAFSSGKCTFQNL